jgi:2'-5' RNA ligase
VIVVPEAEPVIGSLRARYDSAGGLGVPAHVTLLFPFGDDPVGLEELFAAVAAFDFTLVRTAWFPEPPMLYLAPEPTEPFVKLVKALIARYPDFPPYGGAHGTIVPHVTVGHGVPEDDEKQVAATLPIPSRAESVAWLEERADGRWGERRSFSLGG